MIHTKLLPVVVALIVVVILLPLFPAEAQAVPLTLRERLIQQIDILTYEVSVLQSLVTNKSARRPIDAHAYMAVNLANGAVLAQKNADGRHSIASVTKLMAGVVARERIDDTKSVMLTNTMLTPLGQSPVLAAGLTVSTKDLLTAALSQSSNDAVEALAHTAGKEAFLGYMNEKADELSMHSTHFVDVHGLSPQNRSTARDLVALVQYVYKHHPDLLKTTKENDLWLPDASGRLYKFRNVNNFYPLVSFVGGKTGYIPEARQTMASVFTVNNDPVAIVVLNSNNRQADIFSILRAVE